MLVDLILKGKVVLVFGSGDLARAREATAAAEGARVRRARYLAGAKPRGRARGRAGATDPAGLLRAVRPSVVFSSLDDPSLNRRISRAAHAQGALVHVYDAPGLSDFTLPSVGGAGAIHIAVSTSGQSPAMAAVLRRRLERSVRPGDVLAVRLQARLRKTIQRTVPSFEARRDLIYRVLRHRQIRRLLRTGRFGDALVVARQVVGAYATAPRRDRPKASR